MSEERKQPVFLERRTYRLRRLMDAARLLPFVGGAMWAVPLLWDTQGSELTASSRAMLYIFGTWAGLVVLTWGLSLRLDGSADSDMTTGRSS